MSATHCCSGQQGQPPRAGTNEKLGDQIFALEDAVRACRESVANLFEALEPVLLPEPPDVVGSGVLNVSPAACPLGDKLRKVTGEVRHAGEILDAIHRRLAVG